VRFASPNQARGHALIHHPFEHPAQHIAVAEPAVPVDREGRVIGEVRVMVPAFGRVLISASLEGTVEELD
jgi:hypothetical protein